MIGRCAVCHQETLPLSACARSNAYMAGAALALVYGRDALLARLCTHHIEIVTKFLAIIEASEPLNNARCN